MKYIFLAYIAWKKSWKNGHFWTKTIGWPVWKSVNYSTFWTSCFYTLERRFILLEYHKRHFPGQYCLKKKTWKNGHFWTETMGFFRLLELFVFIAWKGVFSFLNIIKGIFLAYIAWKKKLEKCPFLSQYIGLTPLEKCQFFDFLNFLFF